MGVFDSPARLWLPGQQRALAPGEASLDVCQSPGGRWASLSCFWTQRGTSMQLQVTRFLSRGQALTRWQAAFHSPSIEAIEAKAKAWPCLLRCCGTSDPGQ